MCVIETDRERGPLDRDGLRGPSPWQLLGSWGLSGGHSVVLVLFKDLEVLPVVRLELSSWTTLNAE